MFSKVVSNAITTLYPAANVEVLVWKLLIFLCDRYIQVLCIYVIDTYKYMHPLDPREQGIGQVTYHIWKQ
jgi:hypothetical protein